MEINANTTVPARSDIRKDIKLEDIRVERVVAGQYRAYDRVTGDWIATAINCAHGRGKADWQAWGGADIQDSFVAGSIVSRHRAHLLSRDWLPKLILRWSRGNY